MKLAHVHSTVGDPPLRMLPSWVRSSVTGTFLGIGRFAPVAWAIAAVLILGGVLLWRARPRDGSSAVDAKLVAPAGLAVAALFFATTTFGGRWWAGAAGARADRYVYLGAALVLPLVAVAAEAIATTWRHTTPFLVSLLLLPIPFNLTNFDQGVYTEHWMAERRYVLTTAIRMPFATEVPRDVRPMTSLIVLDPVTIGFLLDAADRGDLRPSDVPITQPVIDEFKVRLGVARRIGSGHPSGCRTYRDPIILHTEVGDEIHPGTGVSVAVVANGRPSSRKIGFPSAGGDAPLTVELPGLDLWIGPMGDAKIFKLCDGTEPEV
jgi:hypothetical protein